MKKSVPLILLVVLVFIGVSCQFQHILKGDDVEKKYATAVEMYTKKDYARALQLFDQLVGSMRATDKAQKIYYFYAYCYYGQKDYTMASYYFKRYVTNFPNTKEAEECSFMSAYCYFLNSPEYMLDQTNTYDALKELQLFINTYPNSSRIPECNDLIDKLRTKLEYKDYKIARMYYRMADYTASIKSYNNILKEYPETPHKEEILFLIFKSYHKFAKQSIEEKKKDRYQKAMNAYKDFIQEFPESQYLSEAKSLKGRAEKEMELLYQKDQAINSNINKK